MSADWRSEGKPLAILFGAFALAYALPTESARFQNALLEGLRLVKDYAQEHMALCVVPALFIAGAIGVFISQGAVMRYLGAGANRVVAYGVAAVSGTVLAVCSCTVLPLFAGIYKRGAGLGPAAAFLYAGPAINVLAIILTARILGLELGLARVVGAVVFSVVVGLLMHLIFRRSEAERAAEASATAVAMPDDGPERPLHQTLAFFATMIAILVAANWAPSEAAVGWWDAVHAAKWGLTATFGLAFGLMLWRWYGLPGSKLVLLVAAVLAAALIWPAQHELSFSVGTLGLGWIASRSSGELGDWFDATWGFAKQIIPLLLIGVLVAGFLLGRPEHEGLIPSQWIHALVGGNSLRATFLASLAGAFMYFATLTELPILQTLMGAGMGKGPALALLLAGPALSLPSMLVLRMVMGTRKTLVFCALVVVMATLTGLIFGTLFG